MSKDPNELLKTKSAGEIAKQVADLKIISVPQQQTKQTVIKPNKVSKSFEVKEIFKKREVSNSTHFKIEISILNELKMHVLKENIKTGANIKLQDYINNILEAYIKSNY